MPIAKTTQRSRQTSAKRKAVTRLLREDPARSNSDVAREVGCGHPFVARVRRAVEFDGPDLVAVDHRRHAERHEHLVDAAVGVVGAIVDARAQLGRSPIVDLEVLQ